MSEPLTKFRHDKATRKVRIPKIKFRADKVKHNPCLRVRDLDHNQTTFVASARLADVASENVGASRRLQGCLSRTIHGDGGVRRD